MICWLALPPISKIERRPFSRGRKEVTIRVDRARAAKAGVTVDDIAQTYGFVLGGLALPPMRVDGEELMTWIALDSEHSRNLQSLYDVKFRLNNGNDVDLGAVIDVKADTQDTTIRRRDRMVQATVPAVYDGKEWDETRAAIESKLRHMDFPSGYTWSWNQNLVDQDP